LQESEKAIETFARRHSAEFLDKAPPGPSKGAATAAAATTVSAAGSGLLPDGTDLNAVAKAAATATVV